MTRVFLSYSKKDLELARSVTDLLRSEGFSVWWDKEITPREGWDRAIEREIAAADHVLALWTRYSVESDWVRIEANYARNCRPSKLVQARFDGADVPIAFSLIQFVDLDRDVAADGADWRQLVAWLSVARDGSCPPVEDRGNESPDDTDEPLPAAEPVRAAAPAVRPETGRGIGARDWPLLVGPFLFMLGLAAVGVLRFNNPGESFRLFGVPPNIYLTFLFAAPFVVARKLPLRDILLLVVGIPAVHLAAAGAATFVHGLMGRTYNFQTLFLIGSVGGLVGAALSFGLVLATRELRPNPYMIRQSGIAIMALPLLGGIGTYLAFRSGRPGLFSFALLYLPWQLLFAVYLLKVWKENERQLSSGSAADRPTAPPRSA